MQNEIKEELITIISNRCNNAGYVDVANAVDDILSSFLVNKLDNTVNEVIENNYSTERHGYNQTPLGGSISESIYSSKTAIIPMTDVQHIERHIIGGEYKGISVITKHTNWNYEHDTWDNSIYLQSHEADEFIKCFCIYRHELEGINTHDEAV